jgi:hypothetical protein
MGGSVTFVSESNLEALPNSRLHADGRAVNVVDYHPEMPVANKIRFIVKHPAGVSKRLQVFVEFYKEISA